MDEKAHFFKVILPDTIRDRKLSIPSKFVKNYGKSLPDEVVLVVPNGAKWKVELVKNGNNIWFQNGWPEFVDYYSVSPGSFVVFGYHKIKCCFHVTIFDTSSSEIDYPLCPQSEFEAVRAEGDNINQSDNPSFCITMHPTYVQNRCRLSVPQGFAKRYLKNQQGAVILKSRNGETYPAKYSSNKRAGKRQFSQTHMENGWKRFVRDNHLAVGDVCVFELIDDRKITLQVTVFRGSKNGNRYLKKG